MNKENITEDDIKRLKAKRVIFNRNVWIVVILFFLSLLYVSITLDWGREFWMTEAELVEKHRVESLEDFSHTVCNQICYSKSLDGWIEITPEDGAQTVSVENYKLLDFLDSVVDRNGFKSFCIDNVGIMETIKNCGILFGFLQKKYGLIVNGKELLKIDEL